MYSNIIQIGTEVIGKENFINALTLYEGGYGFFDYCSEVLEAYRKIVIEDFCSCILPEGMFTPIDEIPCGITAASASGRKSGWPASTARP